MLLPGLIDAHVHAWGALERVLARAARFGVTTELDMMADEDGLTELQMLGDGKPGLADLRSSGHAVTVPGAHGTEYGFPVPTVNGADDVGAFVDARVREGAHFIKVIHNEPPPSERARMVAILRAAVDAAHDNDRLVVAHVNSLRSARDAIDAGVDVLGHLFGDRLDESVAADAADAGVAVIATLTQLEGALVGSDGGASVVADDHLGPYLSSYDRQQLLRSAASAREERGRRPRPPDPAAFERALSYIPMLHAAGVPLLAGSDAPNPGTTHGASLHRELELLVSAGLQATTALAAATSVPARVFGLADRGRIAPRQRADLVLVRGDATTDIRCTRDIATVWIRGVEVDRSLNS